MNTETVILIEHINTDIDKLILPELNDEEKSCIHYFIEINRHIQEIDKLFHIFRFNLKSMLHYYTIMNTDRIKRKFIFDFKTSDYIAINALIINFISSGKTLTEAIENFLKEKTGDNSELYQMFKTQCLSEKYDQCFSYRFLLRLRDFSQHGHLPITVDINNICCIDIDQILLTPHFNHNKTILQQIENIRNELHEKHTSYPKIVFTLSIAEFNICITEIYVEFLNNIEKPLQDSIDKIKTLLVNRPELIYKSSDILNGFVLYELDGTYSIHAFNPQGDSKAMYLGFKDIAIKILKKEKNEWDILNASIKKKKL